MWALSLPGTGASADACAARKRAHHPTAWPLELAALLHFSVGINASVMTPKVEC